MAFFDLTKAFDSVNRDALWRILLKYGCPPKFVTIIRLLHDNMRAVILSNGWITDSFEVKKGVEQGRVIAPTFFSIFLATMLQLTTDKLPAGVGLTYRMDGKLFNHNRLRSKIKTTPTSVEELQCADYAEVSAHSEADLQAMSLLRPTRKWDLHLTSVRQTFSINKLSKSRPQLQQSGLKIRLENVEHFSYLESHLSRKADIDEEIQHHLKSASAAFGCARKLVFEDRHIISKTKLIAYHAVVIPTLLYEDETWTT